MRKGLAGLLAYAMVSYASLGVSQEHVVSSAEIQQRLAEVRVVRDRDLARLHLLLQQPRMKLTATVLDIDLESLGHRIHALSDQELRDLTNRAEQLELDPVAGLSNPLKVVLFVVGVVVLLALVVVVSCYTGNGCGD